MSGFVFDENLSRKDFGSLRDKKGIKTHFLGSYAWGEVSGSGNWIPYYTGVRKDGEIVATALILRKKLVAGYSYCYIPRGFTMDWSDTELLRFMTEAVKDFCRRHKAIFFKIDPDIRYHVIDDNGRPVPGENNEALVLELKRQGYEHLPLTYFFDSEQPRYTFRIRTDRDLEDVRKGYDKIVKRRLRQAASDGVEIVEGGREDIGEFVRLMTITEQRQGFFSHYSDYYQRFYDILSKEDMAGLYFAKIDIPALVSRLTQEQQELEAEKSELEAPDAVRNKKTEGRLRTIDERLGAVSRQLGMLKDKPQEVVTASAQLLVSYGGKVWTLYAGNDMEYGKFYSNYAMFDHCVEIACSRGAEFLDAFGTVGKPGVDAQLDGLHEFKKRWGGEYTEFIGEFNYITNRPVYFAYSKLIPLRRAIVSRRLLKEVASEAK